MENNEKKRIYILLAIAAVIVVIIFISLLNAKPKSAGIISDVENILSSETEMAIYVMRSGCSYCQLNESNMTSVKDEYNFSYYNVDIDDLTNDDYSKLLSLLNLDSDNFGTPTLVTVKNNEAISNLSGLRTYRMLVNYLKENNLIDESSKLYLNYTDNYKEVFSSNEPQVVVLATSYCKFCLAEHPVLIDVAKETNVKINYMYLDYMFETQEQYDEFMSSLSWFSENTNWGTPTTLIVKNNEVLASLSGYREKTDIIDFYKVNGIIKES